MHGIAISHRLLVAVAGLSLAACAPTLSSFQPAHVAQQGSVQTEMGQDFCLPTGTVRKAIDAAATIAKVADQQGATDNDKRRLAEAGIAMLLNPVALNSHLGLAYAFADDWDGSLRMTTGGWRLGARHQFLHQATHGYDVTAALGVGRATQEIPRPDMVDKVLEIQDPVRYSLDTSIIAGKHGDFYRLWFGPKALYTHYSTAMTLKLPESAGGTTTPLAVTADGKAFYLGGQLGAGLGYRWLFLAAELTVTRVFSRGDVQITGLSPFSPSLNDWVIYPGIGLLGEF